MKKLVRIPVLGLVIIVCALGSSPPRAGAIEPPEPNPRYKGAEIINTAQLRDYLAFIASDELEGRDTPSRGLDIAAKFIATNLSRWGVKPAGDDGTYADFAGLQGEKWESAAHYAARHGARGGISVAGFQSLSLWEQTRKSTTITGAVSVDRIVAQLNLDMVGRSKQANDTHPANAELSAADEIYVIGSKMMSSTLGELSESVNKSYYNLAFNYKYDDPNDPNKFFFRSDHFCYAQKGIPIIFYTDGEHEDYHKVTDEVGRIDFEKMNRVAKTVYAMAWELAGGMKRPVVDRKLPTELTTGLF